MAEGTLELVLNKVAYNQLFEKMEVFIEDNVERLELDGKSNDVEQPQAATLNEMEIIRTANIKQKEDELFFDVVVSCDIEVEETVRRNREVDSVRQWFSASCSAIFDGELKNLQVKHIAVYHR